MNPHRELPFKKGDILDLTHTVDDNWLKGMLDGRKGIFPKSYVKVGVYVCLCVCGCGCAMCVCVWGGGGGGAIKPGTEWNGTERNWK